MLRTKPDTARDTFIVFDIEDRFNASVCLGEAEAREIIDQFGAGPSIRVHRITLGEMARDVTADFLGEDAADTAFGIPSNDSLRRWHEGRVL
jgi:hypothetical protein